MRLEKGRELVWSAGNSRSWMIHLEHTAFGLGLVEVHHAEDCLTETEGRLDERENRNDFPVFGDVIRC